MTTLSRRQLITTGVLAGAGAFLQQRLRATASQPSTKVAFSVPAGACDCHVHVFGDPQRFPLVPNRVYTPEQASVAELRALLGTLSLDRVVLVQPSVYGTDNSCQIDAIRELGARARGVAVIDSNTTDAALDEMARAGIRGIRRSRSRTFRRPPPG